jgi:hypothetical protein
MRTQTTWRLVDQLFTALRRGCGLALVLAACAGAAAAQSMSGGCHAPEIDAGALASGLTLLTGGILVLTDRFRRK